MTDEGMLQIPVAELRRVAGVLLDHLQAVEGEVVEIPDRLFWSIPAEARYDVYTPPSGMTVGQLGESWEWLSSLSADDAVSLGLVWLADIARAIGEQVVR